ncbi:MAG: HEAT repeat domain-containing protein [Acidobacteriota bacterium]|nr:HEAT repeat domain-containing protein [Acidobacteriota bacterium]
MSADTTAADHRSQNGPRVKRLLRRVGIDFYPGEALPAILLFSSFFFSYTFQYTVKSVRQATFIDSLGSARLPYVYLLVALCSYPVLRLYSRFAERLTPPAMIATTCSLIAASMALFWWLFGYAWTWVPLTFYIWVTILFVLISSQLWSFANHLFEPRQAKRLFGFIGAGGLLGSVAGGQLARLATVMAGTRDALLVAAVVVLGIVGLLYPLRRHRLAGEWAPARRAQTAEDEETAEGLSAIRGSRQLQMISALLVVGVVVAQIVDLQFNWAIESVTGELDQRTVFFGNVFSLMGVTAFIFQFLFAARIHRSLGVGFSTRVLPTTVALGTVALLVTATLGPGAVVIAALALKISENGLRYSFDLATRELLFLPVPSALRRKTKAFIDVFIQRGAKGLAAILLLPVTFGLISALEASWISLALIGLWLWVAAAASREYVRSFRRSLEARTVDSDLPINLADATTLEILVQSLGSADPRQVLHSLDILTSHDRHHLVPPLLLYHDDAEVRLATLRILGKDRREDALHLIERRLNDPDPDVQAEVIRVLARLRNEDACEMMLPRLRDADPRVQGTAIACLMNHGDEVMRREASTALASLLSDGSAGVRVEAAKALGATRGQVVDAELLQLLYDQDPAVVRQSIDAIRHRLAEDGPNPIYLPTLISLLQNRRLKHDAREALICFGEDALPALIHFLNDSDEGVWVRRAIPKTMTRIGSPAATTALLECLEGQSDTFLRRKLIEALALAPEASVDRATVSGEIEREANRHLRTLSDLYSLRGAELADTRGPGVEWNTDAPAPSLLEELLASRLDDHARNIFGLLALIHHPGHIWSAYRSLTGSRAELRGHTLEYLDNTLSAEIRHHVFAAIGDAPLAEKLAEAKRLYGVSVATRPDTLKRLLGIELKGSSDEAFLVVAALYLVHSDKITHLYRAAEELRHSPDPFVSETAAWVTEQIS